MRSRRKDSRGHGPLPTRRWLVGCLLVLLAGCRLPATHLPCAAPTARCAPRKAVLACQLLEDSVIEAACHPLRAGKALLREPVALLEAVEADLFDKRLGRCRSMGWSGRPAGEKADVSLEPAALRLLPDGDEAMTALEAVIDSATCRLDVLMFTWDQGPVGRAVAERLAARAGPNLRVRVLVDGGGNLVFGQPKNAPVAEVNAAVCWLARQPYVEVLRSRNAFVRFDHRKLVLADGRLAWAGGRNFTGMGFFGRHDLSFTLAGPPAARLGECFEQSWRDQGGAPAPPLPPPPPPPDANARLRVVETGPCKDSLRCALYRAVEGAQHHICVENPYVADPGLVARLSRAARRGVEVRVVLCVQRDEESMIRSNRVIANRLRAAGARVYLHPGPLHTKALVVDGCWAYLGSGNFDRLSLCRNREIGVVVVGGSLPLELEQRLFAPDCCSRWELREPLPTSIRDYAYELVAGLFL